MILDRFTVNNKHLEPIYTKAKTQTRRHKVTKFFKKKPIFEKCFQPLKPQKPHKLHKPPEPLEPFVRVENIQPLQPLFPRSRNYKKMH